MYRILMAFIFLVQLPCMAQVNPGKRDSMAQSMDSSAQEIRVIQDSLTDEKRPGQEGSYTDLLNKSFQEKERLEEKKRNERYLFIILGVAAVSSLIAGLVYRRKEKKRS